MPGAPSYSPTGGPAPALVVMESERGGVATARLGVAPEGPILIMAKLARTRAILKLPATAYEK